MSNKTYLEFDGFDEVITRLNKLNANTKVIAEKALKKSHSIITKKSEEGINLHKDTGDTEKSLYREGKVEWAGTLASIGVGFSISKGGLASIFLIYGTPRHVVSNQYGKTSKTTKGVTADRILSTTLNQKKNNAIRKEVLKVQEEIFFEEIRRLNG